jgi:hypothetical protein
MPIATTDRISAASAINLVLPGRVELPRLSAQTSQACVFTNYTTVALTVSTCKVPFLTVFTLVSSEDGCV